MNDDLERRITANEAAFREVNEAIARGQWPGEDDARAGFRCECARLGCNQLIEVTPREYERVRAHPRRFVIAVGHEVLEVEKVIETRPGYVVIEKTDEAGGLAASSDPRA